MSKLKLIEKIMPFIWGDENTVVLILSLNILINMTYNDYSNINIRNLGTYQIGQVLLANCMASTEINSATTKKVI